MLAIAQRALEVSTFDPTHLARIHCFALKSQWRSPSGIRIHHISNNTWAREMQRASSSRSSCPGFYQHSPVINVYLSGWVVRNKSPMGRRRELGKTSTDKRSWSNFRGEGLPGPHAKHLPARACRSDAGRPKVRAEPPSLFGGRQACRVTLREQVGPFPLWNLMNGWFTIMKGMGLRASPERKHGAKRVDRERCFSKEVHPSLLRNSIYTESNRRSQAGNGLPLTQGHQNPEHHRWYFLEPGTLRWLTYNYI